MTGKLALLFVVVGTIAQATVPVVTSTTDLAWAAREIGGQHVEVTALLRGTENPHYIDAVPEFVRLAAEAKVVCVVGLDLEIGWMPKVLTRSGNSKVQPGGAGYCEATRDITPLEKVTGSVDQSMGDIHPRGNPHFWLSPRHMAQGAETLAGTLMSADPANVAAYREGLSALKKRLEELQARLQKRITTALAGHQGPVLIEYHKEFAYFAEAYGLKSLGSIEEKPGVAPSSGRLAEVALTAKQSGARFVLASETAPKKVLERFREMSGLPIVVVPMSIHADGSPANYTEFQETLVGAVEKALAGVGTL